MGEKGNDSYHVAVSARFRPILLHGDELEAVFSESLGAGCVRQTG